MRKARLRAEGSEDDSSRGSEGGMVGNKKGATQQSSTSAEQPKVAAEVELVSVMCVSSEQTTSRSPSGISSSGARLPRSGPLRRGPPALARGVHVGDTHFGRGLRLGAARLRVPWQSLGTPGIHHPRDRAALVARVAAHAAYNWLF